MTPVKFLPAVVSLAIALGQCGCQKPAPPARGGVLQPAPAQPGSAASPGPPAGGTTPTATPPGAATQSTRTIKWLVPDGWHRMEDQANGFRAAFPVQPFSQPQESGVQYLAEYDNMAFSAQMSPVEASRASDDVTLSRICQETFNTGEHRLLTVGTPTHNGKTWLLLAVARDDEGQLYTIRMHLQSGRLFTAFVLTDAEDKGKPAVRQFLDAFQVLP